MENIPKINPRSDRKRQVTAVFYVDGLEYIKTTVEVAEFAIPHVIGAAFAQVDDPDIDGAVEMARTQGDPLPKGYR